MSTLQHQPGYSRCIGVSWSFDWSFEYNRIDSKVRTGQPRTEENPSNSGGEIWATALSINSFTPTAVTLTQNNGSGKGLGLNTSQTKHDTNYYGTYAGTWKESAHRLRRKFYFSESFDELRGKVLSKCGIRFSLSMLVYAFPNFCTQISRPLSCVRCTHPPQKLARPLAPCSKLHFPNLLKRNV